MQKIKKLLQKNIILLDGAMGSELEKRGAEVHTALWSAKILQDNPKIISEVHKDYLRSGADIITTASYQASMQGFLDYGFDFDRAKELIVLSSQLAKKSRDEINKSALVAASIGPYGGYLADGSEFTGKYSLGKKEFKNFHRERMEFALLGGADLFGIETLPNLSEADALCELLRDEFHDIPAWMSFSAKEMCLSSGEKIVDMANIVNRCDNIFATGFNCTEPGFITGLIKELKKFTNKNIIVYPNSGASYDAVSKTWSCSGEFFVDSHVDEWIDLGVKIIGGCCKSSPGDILKLKNKIQNIILYE